MKWFKHFTDASHDEFIAELEEKFGLAGYARWWKILEIIGSQMTKNRPPKAAYPWSVWQTFLKGKRKKLETYLKHIENQRRINLKQTGNILEIECTKLLEIKDEYSKKSGQTPDSVGTNSHLEVEVDTEAYKQEGEEEKPSPPKTEIKKTPTLMDLNLAQVMRRDLTKIKPDYFFNKTENEWACEIAFMKTVMKKNEAKILEVWGFARGHQFWFKRVRWTGDLRYHFQDLEMEMIQPGEESLPWTPKQQEA